MRKLPKQGRSRALVKSIVQATRKAIVQYGYDGFTTKHVADLAGVSVGSLYQYFESKQDLVDALLDSVSADLAKTLNKLAIHSNQDLKDMVELSVNFGFAFLKEDDGLSAELIRNWDKLPANHFISVLQNTLLDFMRLYLLKNRTGPNPERLHVRSFVIANSVIFSIIRAMNEPSPFITEEDLKAELIFMVMTYLQA